MSMPREDELALIAQARAGDRKAMAALWTAWEPLAWKLANRVAKRNQGVDPEDLKQEGYFAMTRAVAKFDPSRGVAFMSYLYRCMSQQMNDHLLRHSGGPLQQADLDGVAVDPPAPEDDTEAVDRTEQLRAMVRQLPARERKAIELYYGLNGNDPLSLEELGNVLGVSHSWASTIICNARKRLRESASNAGRVTVPTPTWLYGPAGSVEAAGPLRAWHTRAHGLTSVSADTGPDDR